MKYYMLMTLFYLQNHEDNVKGRVGYVDGST